jgi:murein DD-endopeptidase MepM/ murein hydrolase activator NlpD
MFEKNEPQISVDVDGYWNLKKPLHLKISDDSGVIAYRVSLVTPEGTQELQYEQLIAPQTQIALELQPPRMLHTLKEKSVKIVIQAKDISKWNYFRGNNATKELNLVIDKKRPMLSVISNSYSISRGGCALVIFRANDENLNEIYIQGNSGKKFKPQTFYENGNYISLIAWPIIDPSFKATVVATDKAGNIAKAHVPLYLIDKPYKVSNITLSDSFLGGKIADLAEEFEETQGVDQPLEQFKIINEKVRYKNEKLIYELSSQVRDEKVDDFKIEKMYPLRNGQVVAHFGDHRKYFYNNEYISESYHMGLDLASNAMAPIKAENPGEIVYADYNGLYGNMPMLYHGLGLYTIYGHCSSIAVSTGDVVAKGETIANTGTSGYAMGDHLHFGILVQGIEVRPQEWMDEQWIRLNVTDIINSAKATITRN